MSNDDRNREKRLRRRAAKCGLRLRKYRIRTAADPRFGRFYVIDARSGALIRLAASLDLNLDDVERILPKAAK